LNKTKNKLAIFDIDGTLTDSVKIHQSAFIKALNNFGLFDFNTNWSSYKHHTDSYIFKTIFEAQLKKTLVPKDIEHFEDLLYELISEAIIQSPIIEIDGAKKFLSSLQYNSDFDIVFATGSLFNPAKLKLEQVGISLPDTLIISANKIFSRDELILKAIETAKVFYSNNRYEQIISFGDGLWDYETSKNINIDFIGIGNEKLKEYNVPSFYVNFRDIELFKSLNIEKAPFGDPDFEVKPKGKISEAFLKNGILTFRQATKFIQNLPYGRNPIKNDLTTLFTDNCGTCSTKHAILKQLAVENNFADIILICGLFRMSSHNTPEISSTLNKHGLDFIPEAHNYLKYKNQILDFTKTDANAIDFIDDLIEEIEILPHQITDYKVNYHKKYLEKWLENDTKIKLSLADLWAIREQCIQDLTVA
jgi:phosphoglycolate phosphatase-like HAD superfamily hydrolase